MTSIRRDSPEILAAANALIDAAYRWRDTVITASVNAAAIMSDMPLVNAAAMEAMQDEWHARSDLFGAVCHIHDVMAKAMGTYDTTLLRARISEALQPPRGKRESPIDIEAARTRKRGKDDENG